ncbi:MAG TPA: SpoIIE family protein phosphatase [Patescibacteria group bacterium]|nr:SpoIIE family protein phosphatase [Patescibacteria group bacterium]
MNHFPQKRSWAEAIALISLTAASLLAFFGLKQYWLFPDDARSIKPQIESIADSLIAAHGLHRDSVTLMMRPVDDDDLSEGVVDSIGAFAAREYFKKEKTPYTLIEGVLTKSTGSGNFNINLGGSSRRNADAGGSNTLMRYMVGRTGEMVSFKKNETVEFDRGDTAAILDELLKKLPREKYELLKNAQWMPANDAVGIAFTTTTREVQYHTEQIRLQATPLNTNTQNLWQLGWEKLYVPRSEATASGRGPTLGIVVGVLIAIVIIGYIGVFVVQLRKRAVSIAFTLLISAGVALYFFASVFTIMPGLPWIALVLFFIGYFVFIGFLLAGMPTAGIVSLSQEMFPEKFYTTRRFKNQPWKSYFTGRSVLWGIATGIFSFSIMPALFLFLKSIGSDSSLQNTIFNSAWDLLLLNPLLIVLSAFLFIPLINNISVLVGPTITKRIPFLKKLPVLAPLLISAIAGAVISSMQGSADVFVLLTGALGGIIGFLVFYYVDFLALVVSGIVSTMLYFMPAIPVIPWIATLFIATLTIITGFGLMGFFQTPEQVDTEDYIPDFLKTLEDEKRMREELVAAKVVQSRLLPTKMPSYPALDVAAICIPAFEVGGDYYDFFHLDERHLGILIGDVSGKGMSAAFYITLAKGVIVSQVRMALSPADVLSRVNKLLYETMERGKFISLVYGVLDTETMEFTYAQAGHNPLVIRYAETNSAAMLHARGLALGLDSGAVFDKVTKNSSITLKPGDALVMYTDGVTEAMNTSGEEYSEERFCSVISKADGTSINIMDEIVTDVKSFIGKAKQHDDITIVVMKCDKAHKQALKAVAVKELNV